MKEPRPPSRDAIDLVERDAATIELTLGTGEKRDHLVAVAPGPLAVKVTHVGGPVGTMFLRIYDTDHPKIPVDSSDMTCVEPGGCSIEVTVGVADETRELRVQVEVSIGMTVRLELNRLAN